MVFSSFEFILWFLPFFLLVYYTVPEKHRNLCIFIFSMVFYAYGALAQPVYILILLASIGVNYLAGLCIAGIHKYRKLFLIAGIVIDLSVLFVFKYADFFIENINRFGLDLPMQELVLPIGISFYTFQEISYLIDVYRRDIHTETSILNLGTYIVMFPQLVAGPIVRYETIRDRLEHRVCTREDFIYGVKLFVAGLGSKVLLANRLSGLWQAAGGIGYESISTPLAWMAAAAFSFQIYFDFYGYSLMAIGLGKMFGFELPDNFRHPYISKSMTEFWRRWHITLGAWFRDYVYIPLGGNRKGIGRTYLNLFIVWTLTGFWHGASWNFILWGMFLFAVIAVEKSGLLKILETHRVIGHIYMIILIPVSWMFFAIEDVSEIGVFFQRMIGAGGVNVFAGDFIKYGMQYGIFLLAGIIFCTPLPRMIFRKLQNKYIRAAILAAVAAGSFYCIYKGMNDPFLYFRF